MAATGRMSTFHAKSPDVGGSSHFTSPVTARTPPSQYQWPLGQNDPPQELERISYVHQADGKQPSPGLAQGRWSHHAAEDDADVPLSAVPRDDVGPGNSQTQDPFLHEQYFGVASSGVDSTPELTGYVYPAPDERGHFVR